MPKTEKALDPKRLKKILPKQLKEIKKDKRIILIGTSSNPFEADVKSFTKVYERIIMVPRPCYGDRRLIWTHFITLKIPITDCKAQINIIFRSLFFDNVLIYRGMQHVQSTKSVRFHLICMSFQKKFVIELAKNHVYRISAILSKFVPYP